MKVIDVGGIWGDICIEIKIFKIIRKIVMEFECQLHLGW